MHCCRESNADAPIITRRTCFSSSMVTQFSGIPVLFKGESGLPLFGFLHHLCPYLGYGLHRLDTTCHELTRINTTCYELHRINTTCHETSHRNGIGNGKVFATCRPLAASCNPKTYRYRIPNTGIDEWESRCDLLPCGSKLRLRRLPIT